MLCGFGNNTKERVMDTFVTNNLVSPQPRADGSFYVTKIEEFDAENRRLSEEMLREHNILNYFWVREGNTARFSDTVAHLVDVVSERSPLQEEETESTESTPGLPDIAVPKNWKSPC